MPENILYINGEESLCSMGKKAKTFSYIDEEEQQYVIIDCRLKEEITEMDLKRFFNQVYSAKLSNAYEKIFDSQYTTLDFIHCLKEILKEDRVITLKSLYEVLNKENNANWMPLIAVMHEFFKMFDFSATYYRAEVFGAMERYAIANPWFIPKDSNFPAEANAMYYNSYIINTMYYGSKIQSTKKEQFKKRELSKIQQKAS